MKSAVANLGNPIFNRVLFVLNRSITPRNHLDYRFMNRKLREIAPGIWVMPAYLDRQFSLFFVFTKIKTGQTVVAFSTGRFNSNDHSFRLSHPMITGRGLNRLHERNANRALRVAHFLNQISKAAEGNWRMVKK